MLIRKEGGIVVSKYSNTVKKPLLLLSLFLIITSIFCIPVEAAGYTVTPGVKNTIINCAICKDAEGNAINHSIENSQYNKRWAGITTDASIGKIQCKLCKTARGGTVTHCAIALAENSTNEMAYNIVVGANSDFLSYTSILGTGSNSFTLDSILKFDSATYSTELETIRTGVYPALVGIGELIIAIYFVLELGEMSLNDRLSYESLIFTVVKSLVACLVIANAMDWIILGLDTCSEIFNTLSGTPPNLSTSVYKYGQCIYDRIFKGSTVNVLGEVITSSIYCLFIAISYVVIYVICWTRVFDIFIRIVFAPIGMADFMHGGTNCLAVRYFKKLLSSVLQGACIMGVMIAYSAIGSSIRGGATGPVVGIIVGFAVIITCQQTSKLANDIVGA
jgi:hypothetical protein